jgi:hypothetical protein
MKQIWDDGGLTEQFRNDFEQWAEEFDGSMEELGESAVFCEFGPQSTVESVRLGVYDAEGQHVLRFDTIREEIELKVLSKYTIDGSTLAIESDQGSRQFEIDVRSGNWSVRRRQV